MSPRRPSRNLVQLEATSSDANQEPIEKEGDADPIQLWKRCVQVGSAYFTDEESKTDAWKRLAGVVGLALAQTGFSVGFSFLNKDFWNALNGKQEDEFYHILTLQLVAFAVATPIFALRDFYAGKLSNSWRQHVTNRLLGQYIEGKTYYALGAQAGTAGGLDNPDQRIVDDIRNFTDFAVSLFLSLFNALVDLVSFSTVLVSIYTPLLYALAVYAIGGTCIAYQIGRSLVGTQNSQEQKEADFRYGLIRFRENAEGIAFYDNEADEQAFLKQRFTEAFENFELLVGRRRNLEMFQTGYRLLVQVLPIAVVSPMYFSGSITLGVVTQSYGAFNHVLSDLSLIVNRFEALSQFSTCTNRLAFLIEAIEAQHDRTNSAVTRIERTIMLPSHLNAVVLRTHDVTLRTPDGRLLVEAVTMEIHRGEALLVTGASGTGKTSFCRMIAGLPLWNNGDGQLAVPPRAGRGVGAGCQCLPQQPYMLPQGSSLRQQLAYLCDSSPTDEECSKSLKAVGLEALLSDLDVVSIDWRTLSPGEQQRLAFARLLLAPEAALVVLDEATSALDEALEARCYAALRKRGSALLSVGHRSALRACHDKEFQLLGGGAWSMVELDAGHFAASVEVEMTNSTAP